jgi:signal transduction histidine kinase
VTDSLQRDLKAVAEIKAVPLVLDIICRSAGVGFAAIGRITDSHWIAAAVRDDMGLGLQPGSELPIETTICNEIREGREPVVIEDAATDARFSSHPAPPLFGFKSYISVPILRADGTFYGTLCGLDPEPRPLRKPETIAMFEAFAELVGFHLSAIDREAETEADLLNERKTSALNERFIAVLGHDLRNPLTAILGGMEMLRKNPLNDRAQQWAEMVVASAGRMAELIDVVVDFSRSRLGGGLIVDCAECDTVEAALRALLAALQSAKPSRRILSSFDIGAPISCDQRRVLQLASNLLSNALTYGDPDRPIELEARTLDGWFDLSVANAGAPIPAALLAHIFEPFSRGAVQPSREGLGLGLYISHQIAQAHGGTLNVVSTPEETRFTFRMPLQKR